MRRSRSLVHTLYLLIIAVLATLLYVERSIDRTIESEPSITPQADTGLTEHADERRQQHAALQERLDYLEASLLDQLANLQNQVSQLNQDTDVDSIDGNASADEAIGMVSADAPATLDTTMLDDFAAHQQRFDIQSVDPDWAYRTRERIVELFRTDGELRARYRLDDIECRTTLCQVDISEQTDVASLESTEHDPTFLRQAMSKINTNEHGLRYLIRTDHNNRDHRVLVERLDD